MGCITAQQNTVWGYITAQQNTLWGYITAEQNTVWGYITAQQKKLNTALKETYLLRASEGEVLLYSEVGTLMNKLFKIHVKFPTILTYAWTR